jgi:hypothetical protein
MSQERERRPVLAALLSVLQPGLGHVYLREWLRACLWAGVWTVSLAGVAVSAGVDLTDAESVVVAFGLFPGASGLPPEAALAIVAVTAVSTLDAYWLTARNNHRIRKEASRCPHCGRGLDPTLSFCHWCTEPRDGDGTA